jgi:2Fe-2S ferredoxin
MDLLDILQQNDEPITTSCGGVARCGLCLVTIVSGSEALGRTRSHELDHLEGNPRSRLACQAEVRGDLDGDHEVVVRVLESHPAD